MGYQVSSIPKEVKNGPLFSVIRDFRITAVDGRNYNTRHYNLPAIIAVGYKVNSERAVQFRKWATTIIQEFTIKGYTMDDERLKNDGTILNLSAAQPPGGLIRLTHSVPRLLSVSDLRPPTSDFW